MDFEVVMEDFMPHFVHWNESVEHNPKFFPSSMTVRPPKKQKKWLLLISKQ